MGAASASSKTSTVTYAPQILIGAGAGDLSPSQIAQIRQMLEQHGAQFLPRLTQAPLAGAGQR